MVGRPLRRIAGIGWTTLAALGLLLAACAPPASKPEAPASTPFAKAAPTKPAAAPSQEAKPAAKEAEKPAAKPAGQAVDTDKMAAYFEGKTVELVITFGPGGGYDIRGRLFAEFLPRYIPGKPSIAVQNIAGGGGLQAVRQVMRAKPDGLTMVFIPSQLYIKELLGEDQEGFEVDTPMMLGNFEVPANDYTMLLARTQSASSWSQLLEKGRQGYVFKYGGGSGVGGAQGLSGEYLDLVGAPVKVVYGYAGSNEVLAALDRGEIDLIGVDPPAETVEASFPRIRTAFPEWLSGQPKFITPILALRTPPPQAWLTPFGWQVPPHALEVVQATDLQKESFRLAHALREGTDVLTLPPKVPDDVYQALLMAVEATANDPAFIAEMSKRAFDGGYRSPEQIKATFDEVGRASPEKLAVLKKMYYGTN